MEITLKIEVEPELFAKLYARFGDKTPDAVRDCLHQLVESSQFDRAPGTRQKAKNTNFRYRIPPGPDTETGRVWKIAEQEDVFDLTKSKKKGKASRESVVKACEQEGIKTTTATTQFYHWQKAAGVMAFQDQTLMDNDHNKLTDEALVRLWHETFDEALHLDKRNAAGEFQYVKDIRRHFNQAKQGHGRRNEKGDIEGRPDTISQPYNEAGEKYWYSERWKRACQQDRDD